MKTFYKIISVVFQPLLVPSFAVGWLMTIAPFVNFPAQFKTVAIGFSILFTFILPLSSILILKKQGFISNFDISDKNERTMPYFFTFLWYLLWWVFLWRTLRLPLFISSIGLSSALALLLMIFINSKWKISAHLCGIGAAFAFVVGVSFRFGNNPILLIIIMLAITALLAISRIELKQHTPAQALAGFAMGFICAILPTVLLNY
jgi:membrane-associated phospholipid phosphatase